MDNPLSIIEGLLALPPQIGSTHIVAIDGRAGSGKTTFSENLSLFLSQRQTVEVLHLDEIYSGWEEALGNELTSTLSSIVSTLKSGDAPTIDIFNWLTSCYDSTRTISNSDVFIIEGVGSAQRVIREVATTTIWLEIDPRIGLERVLARDGNIIESHMREWQKSEEKHFKSEQTMANVDFIFSTT